jgi:creatinine amidohydrolase/Fe(II)-dependent formamide hydrolase-like protein
MNREEIFFDRMIPDEIVRRRLACPVAYLPVGALEWHGAHLPFGTDYLIVEYLAGRAAGEIGGVAFPAIYYGDVRYWLHDSREEWREEYVKEMQINHELASDFPLKINAERADYDTPMVPDEEQIPDPLPFSLDEQRHFFARLVAYTLLEVYHYGFRAIILLPGHGPNLQVCSEAEKLYAENARRRKSLRPPAVTKTFAYFESAKEIEPLMRKNWIHADKWETSLMMAAKPDTVHPEKLPEDRKSIPPAYLGFPYLDPHAGYSERYRELWENFDALDPRHAFRDYGQQHLNHALKRLREEVDSILRRL